MPRANRYYSTGHSWHITQRCYKKFPLTFSYKHNRIHCLITQSQIHDGLTTLNYTIKSSHMQFLMIGKKLNYIPRAGI